MPKSLAIWVSVTSGSRFSATLTTSSRNSWGNGVGIVIILPDQRSASQIECHLTVQQARVGCRVGDLDGVLALTFAPGAVDEVRGDGTGYRGFRGEFRERIESQRSTAVFSRPRESFRSAWAMAMAASMISSGMISCSCRLV